MDKQKLMSEPADGPIHEARRRILTAEAKKADAEQHGKTSVPPLKRSKPKPKPKRRSVSRADERNLLRGQKAKACKAERLAMGETRSEFDRRRECERQVRLETDADVEDVKAAE